MTALTLRVSFPTGSYLAHDGRDRADWPPSPSRVAAALLATAHRRGDPAGIEVVRRLFGLAAPTLWVPPGGRRDTDVHRWVPVPVEYAEATGRFGRGGPGAKILKGVERGMSVGDGAVYLRYEHTDFTAEDRGRLDDVAQSVVYLGRPTSPVLLERADDAQGPEPEHEVWRPDDRGTHLIGAAIPAYLDALDRREERRAAQGVGAHPPLMRPQQRYRRELSRAGGRPEPARLGLIEAVGEEVVYVATPSAAPSDVLGVLDALAVSDGDLALPHVGELSQEGMVVPRLFGVLLRWARPDGRAREITPCVVAGRVCDLQARSVPRRAGSLTAEQRLIAAAWGTGRAWTTVAPCRLSDAAIMDRVTALTDATGAHLVEVQTHGPGRRPGTPDVSHHPQYRHVSLLLDRLIEGPVTLDGTVLLPIDMAN